MPSHLLEILPELTAFVFALIVVVAVRFVPEDLRRKNRFAVALANLRSALSLLGSIVFAGEFFLRRDAPVGGPPEEGEKFSREEMDARIKNIEDQLAAQADRDGGTVVSATNGVMTVPFPGKVKNWAFYFKFTTDCENDHFATLTSPEDRRLIVMDRGLGRCSGVPTTYSSFNSDGLDAFLGTEALGEWTFSMLDLDDNQHSGTLDEVWMILTLENDETVSKHRITLDGLPTLIQADGD